MRLVACSDAVYSVLSGLGEPSAAADAADCPSQIRQCRQLTNPTASGPSGAAVKLVKLADGSWSFTGNACTPAGAALPPVTADDVRQRLVRLVPGAAIGLAPSGATLVNIQTVVWVNAPRQRTLGPLTILGRRVDVTLTLDHVRYDFGDGSSAARPGPGTAYDRRTDPCRTALCPGYDGHVYRRPGPLTVTATVAWRARFAVDGGDPVPVPGTVSGPAAQADLLVREARGVLVPDPGRP